MERSAISPGARVLGCPGALRPYLIVANVMSALEILLEETFFYPIRISFDDFC
jgi:hypothetical protein